MTTPEQELAELGFQLVQRRRDGSMQYTRRANVYLNYWATIYADGTAELTWEFALGQYLLDKGLSVSGQDELSLLLFPRSEIRGRFGQGWAAHALSDAESVLRSIDFVGGS